MNFSNGFGKIAIAIIGAGLSVCGISSLVAAKTSLPVVIVSDDAKAVLPEIKRQEKQEIKIDPLTGGLDYQPNYANDLIMSPKEYGLSIYHGNKRKRSNRLRFSHKAKLKRRLN